jgi:hypothetical protein
MRAIEFLVEYARAPLYHATSIENAEQILQDGMLSKYVRGESEGQISLTRSFQIGVEYAEGRRPAGAVFVLDQTALKQALGRKMQPYDWQQGTGGGTEEEEEAVWDRHVPMNPKTIIEIIIVTNEGWHSSHNSPDDATLAKEFPLVFSYPTKFYRPEQRKISPRSYRGIYKQSPASLVSKADFDKHIFSAIKNYAQQKGSEDFDRYTLQDVKNIAQTIKVGDPITNLKTVARWTNRGDLITKQEVAETLEYKHMDSKAYRVQKNFEDN